MLSTELLSCLAAGSLCSELPDEGQDDHWRDGSTGTAHTFLLLLLHARIGVKLLVDTTLYKVSEFSSTCAKSSAELASVFVEGTVGCFLKSLLAGH